MAIMLRFALAICAASSLRVGHAQLPSTRVTLTELGASAKAVLDAIGQQTGLELRIAGDLGREPITVSVKEIPLAELMPRLATVLEGEWQHPQEGVYELTHSSLQRQEDRQQHLALRSGIIRKGIDENAVIADIGTTWTEKEFKAVLEKRRILNERKASGNSWGAYEAVRKNEQKFPIGRAVARLMRLLSPQDLAALDWDERIVFSTAPTRMQKPLPSGAMAVIQALNKEHAAVIDASQAVPDGTGVDRGNVYSDVPQWYRADLVRPVSRIVVVAQRRGMFDGIEVRMSAIDSTGNVVLYGQGSIGDQAARPIDPDLRQLKAAITLSPEGRDYLRPLQATSVVGLTTDGRIPDATMRDYLRPDEREPLRFVIGEGLLQAAKADGSSIVAYVPDVCFALTLSVESGKTPVGELLARLSGMAAVEQSDGWLIVKPSDRYEALLHRTPRVPLARYLTAVGKSIFPSLDDEAAFAVAFPFPDFSSIGIWVERALGRRHVIWSRGMLNSSRRALRFWGLLTPAQKRSLTAGDPLPLIQLSPEQRTEAEFLTFRCVDAAVETTSAATPVWRSFMMGEPTTELPTGLPSDMRLTMSVVARTVPYGFGDRGSDFIQALNSTTVAMNRLTEEDGNEENVTIVKKFRMGSEQANLLRFEFAPTVRREYSLMSAEVDMSKPMIGYEGLPEDFRKAVEAEIQRQKEWRAKNKIQRAPPGKNPPPLR